MTKPYEPLEIVIKNSVTHEAMAHLKFANYSDLSGAWNALIKLRDSGHIASYLDFLVIIPDSRLTEIQVEVRND